MAVQAHESRILHSLTHLASHGWVPLRAMAALLGYAHATGIYARQRGKNPIPVVKIGGIYRVYADDVIQELQNVPECDQIASKAFLRIYRSLLKEQQNNG